MISLTFCQEVKWNCGYYSQPVQGRVSEAGCYFPLNIHHRQRFFTALLGVWGLLKRGAQKNGGFDLSQNRHLVCFILLNAMSRPPQQRFFFRCGRYFHITHWRQQ
jgi:hypothetical protein